MNKEADVEHVPVASKRTHLNRNKIEAALCIALSAIVSLSLIAWLLS